MSLSNANNDEVKKMKAGTLELEAKTENVDLKDFPTFTVVRRKIIKKSAFWKRFDEPMVGEYEL